MSELRYYRVPSPLGMLVMTFTKRGLRRLEFSDREFDDELIGGWEARRFAMALYQYFLGSTKPFPARLDLRSGTPFQRKVWEELRRVPFGTTISYGELARRVGAPKAARAVAQAVAANPIPIIIPCHRVIRANGKLGGYSAGVRIKKWLLRHEAESRESRDSRRDVRGPASPTPPAAP